MEITWHGHACFSIRSGDYTVVLDPYDGVPGYPPLHLTAQQVLCSHEHFDHNCRAAVALLPAAAPSPFTVTKQHTFHDDRGGALRGGNTVHILCAEGLTVAHLGDLGHLLTPEQAQSLTGCDVLLLPVGGTYTVTGAQAAHTVRQLRPRIAVPMHYRRGEQGFDNIDELSPFLSCFASGEIHPLSGRSFDPAREVSGIVIPK